MEYWMIVKVLCTDGKMRVGMLQQGIYDDCEPKDYAIDNLYNLHFQYALAVVGLAAEKMSLPEYSNDEEYDEEQILKPFEY